MKKIVAFLIMFALALPSFASSEPSENHLPKSNDPEEVVPFTLEEVRAIEKRIMEIKDMDRSELSRAEKKELRKELREMRKEIRKRDEHRHRSSGIFISTGAIIIILLLIIIL